ncbi:hypothetical protein AB0B31_28285 [Catellatospora citrea]|uniref:hypothetical protein n=1 Tax=Catellatospora citrea TaxID=53366 RepID=UPI0034035822
MNPTSRLAACLVGLALLVSGCSDSSSGAGGTKSYEEALQEYGEAKSKLKLPPNVGEEGWGRPLMKESDGQPVVYQDGAATMTLELSWLCAWQKEWLSTRGVDAAREREAMSQLEAFPNMRTYASSFDDGTRAAFDANIAAARLGDPGPIRNDVQLNCA